MLLIFFKYKEKRAYHMKQGFLKFENDKNIIIKNLTNNSIVKIPSDIKKYWFDMKCRNIIFQKLKKDGFWDNRNKSDYSSLQTLNLFIIVSNACNLNCSYCFEHNKKEVHMSERCALKILKYIECQLSKHAYTSLDITYSGGEPFFNTKIIKFLSEKITKKYTAQYEIKFSIITNGTIQDQKFYQFLNQHKFNMQISFDGFSSFHNSVRTNDQMEKTFETICQNISFVLHLYHQITITLRINIINKNIENYHYLLDFLKYSWYDYYIQDRISHYFAFLDITANSPMFFSDKDKLKVIMEITLKEIENGFKIPASIISCGKCMIRDCNSIVIDANGDLYECFSFIGTEQMIKGNLDFIDSFEQQRNCKQYLCSETFCGFYHSCQGGCIYANYLHHHSLSPYCKKQYLIDANKILFLCELYKKNIITKHEIKEDFAYVSYDEFDLSQI